MPITKELLKEYKKDRSVFFETGTYDGDGVKMALGVGFSKIFSVEMAEEYYKKCRNIYAGDEKITLVHDNSVTYLDKVINDMEHPLNTERCFIYLDAHPMGGTGPLHMDEQPVVAELKAIAKLQRNDHTIVVDDFRILRDGVSWATHLRGKDMKEEFRKLFLAINEDYQISYHADPWDDEDLIIVHVK